MNFNVISRRAALLALLVPLLGLGCGTDEYSPQPAQPGPPAAVSEDLAVKDLSDTSVTAIELSTSVDYDPDQNVVEIFALVKDQDGNDLSNLNKYNFSVVLNPKTAPRAIAADQIDLSTSASGDNVVALVIDSSGSMSSITDTGQTRIAVAKEAAKLYVGLMGPGDQTAIVDFDDTARVVQPLTADQSALDGQIDKFTASGATNLGAAITEAVRAVGTRPGRRAVIVLTDGDDTVDPVAGGPDVWMNDSTSTRYQGLSLAKENSLVIYTVGLGSDLSLTGIADLQTFASETGGKFFQAPTAESLLTAFGQTIPNEVSAQTPLETFLLSFENPIPKAAGAQTDVPLGVTAFYENGNGRHSSNFSGTYTVK